MRMFLLLLILHGALYSGNHFQYKVEREDTLQKISDKFKTTTFDLLEGNNLKNRNILYIGERLNVPLSYTFLEPEVLSRAEILDLPAEKWNNPAFNYCRWDYNSKVIIFDTLNYSVQSLFFKRLAYYIEKQDHTGKIYQYGDLVNKRGWNGHDYRARDLARFFNRLNRDGIKKTKGEEALLDILLKTGLLVQGKEIYRGFDGAVISISRGSNYRLRKSILNHEILHALYFTSPEFRVYSATVWNTLSPTSKEIWILYLGALDYDTDNRDLIINEFVAYNLQSSPKETYSYLKNVAYYRLIRKYPGKRDKIESFYRISSEPFSMQIGKLRKFTDRVFKNLY